MPFSCLGFSVFIDLSHCSLCCSRLLDFICLVVVFHSLYRFIVTQLHIVSVPTWRKSKFQASPWHFGFSEKENVTYILSARKWWQVFLNVKGINWTGETRRKVFFMMWHFTSSKEGFGLSMITTVLLSVNSTLVQGISVFVLLGVRHSVLQLSGITIPRLSTVK